MTLIKSISGIRGTIGGKEGDSLTPLDVVKFTSAYALLIREKDLNSNTIIIGRDARVSGEAISKIVSSTLISLGFNVIDIGLSTTPTVAVSVTLSKSDGGIVISASHNPKDWNALKLLNNRGEFLSEIDGKKVLEIADNNDLNFSSVNDLGEYYFDDSFNARHIDKILNLDLVNVDLVKSMNFKVVLDAVNSTGGFMVPMLLKKMGVECIELYCDPNGDFPHNPEPLPSNLTEISKLVISERADFGIAVDPDVDRLAMVCEDGTMFGEEYTLVAIADFVLSKTPGNTVSNLSSTRALADITKRYKVDYTASPVGEVNVVEAMKETDAVIGGEGNGGVIYPLLNYGRDALLGIALFLTQLSEGKVSVKTLRSSYPNYFISKNKIKLTPDINVDNIFNILEKKYQDEKISTIDGLKIDFKKEWVHLRKSNTEPVIRIYAESTEKEKSIHLAESIINQIKEIIK